jgi:hypothetical protein
MIDARRNETVVDNLLACHTTGCPNSLDGSSASFHSHRFRINKTMFRSVHTHTTHPHKHIYIYIYTNICLFVCLFLNCVAPLPDGHANSTAFNSWHTLSPLLGRTLWKLRVRNPGALLSMLFVIEDISHPGAQLIHHRSDPLQLRKLTWSFHIAKGVHDSSIKTHAMSFTTTHEFGGRGTTLIKPNSRLATSRVPESRVAT